jgi:hypothetical protein
MKSVLGTDVKYASIVKEVESKFDLSDVKNKEGLSDKYLSYHFKGFSSFCGLSGKMISIKSDVYSCVGKAVAAASYSNYKAIVVLDKNAYFQGEQVTGKLC